MKGIWHIAQTSGKIQLVTLLIVGLFFLVGGYALLFPGSVQGAALTSVSDTLSTSAPSVVANHTILFVTPTGVTDTGGETITLTFAAAFNMGSVAFGDIDLGVDDDAACDGAFSDQTLAATAGADTYGVDVSGQVITFTGPSSGTNGIPANRCVEIKIGTNASGGSNQITNGDNADTPSADIDSIDFAGTFGDTGTALVAIITGVTVSVTVDESLSFIITGVTDATCASVTDGAGGEVTTTDTTVPFGTAAIDTFVSGCLDLQVKTNATDGYTTTVEKNQLLTSGSDTIADGSCDATCSVTVIDTWDTSATNPGFAYCMKDAVGNAAATADSSWTSGANQCGGTTQGFKLFPTTATTEGVMSSAAPTADDTSNTGYRISVDGSQAAGSYTATITYITTPIF